MHKDWLVPHHIEQGKDRGVSPSVKGWTVPHQIEQPYIHPPSFHPNRAVVEAIYIYINIEFDLVGGNFLLMEKNHRCSTIDLDKNTHPTNL